MRQALEPAHTQLLSQISKLPGGVKDIVDMRGDLLVSESCLQNEKWPVSIKNIMLILLVPFICTVVFNIHFLQGRAE